MIRRLGPYFKSTVPQSIVVHNLEDAETYLLLGFHVVMTAGLVNKLSIKDHVIHFRNNWEHFTQWPQCLVTAWAVPWFKEVKEDGE